MLIISNYMFRSAISALFSRSKPGRIMKKNTKAATADVLEDLYGIDDNFNYLDGLPQISVVDREAETKWIKQLKKSYDENNYDCLQMLRNRQQKYLQKIGSIQTLQTNLAQFMNLKISTYVKFRKWEDLLVDCDNRSKLVKQANPLSDNTSEFLKIYNQKCIASIMCDHDRLHSFLNFKKMKTNQKNRKNQQERVKETDLGLLVYSTAAQRAQLIQKNEDCYQIYFQTVILQATGLLILGEVQVALKLLSKLTGNNFTPQMKQQVYILIITALSFQNKAKEILNQEYLSKIGQCKTLTGNDANLIALKSLNASTAQLLINNISKKVHQKLIEEIPKAQFLKYARLVCLLAQNYYLQGSKSDTERLLALLEKHSDANDVKLLLIFIKMGIHFDNGQFQEVIKLFQSYKASEINMEKQVAGNYFFELNSINNDLLRINIYKLMINVYKELKVNEKQQQIRDEAEAMETTLLSYTLKQPQFSQEQLQKIEDWRLHKEVRIPYYYFNLKLDKYFTPDWLVDYGAI